VVELGRRSSPQRERLEILEAVRREALRMRIFQLLLGLPLVRKVLHVYRDVLTARGRYVLLATAVVAILGLNPRENLVFELFAVGAAMLIAAFLFAFWPPPRVRMECRLPARTTARSPVSLAVRLENRSSGLLRNRFLSFPQSKPFGNELSFEPGEVLFASRPGEVLEIPVRFQALRRGKYVLRGPSLRVTDPLGLVAGRAQSLPDQALLVYPRFYTMEEFIVPVGRRYQPGGIPLASNTGDSVEFMGAREYQQGDPVKNIHWRSWARLGEPVIKEFHEEYFCRLALILDTLLPRRPRSEEIDAFEAAISVAASIADFFSRSDYIVDILAAGPEIYEVSAGRSLAYLENILDVLACLEPCYDPPFEAVGPALFDKLAQITSVVTVLQDWDPPREEFLQSVKDTGTEVRAIVVKDGETTKPWEGAGELDWVSLMSSDDVERLLAADSRGV